MIQARFATRIAHLAAKHRDDEDRVLRAAVRAECKRSSTLVGPEPWLEYAFAVKQLASRRGTA